MKKQIIAGMISAAMALDTSGEVAETVPPVQRLLRPVRAKTKSENKCRMAYVTLPRASSSDC